MNYKTFYIVMLFVTFSCTVIAAEKKAAPQDSIFLDMKKVAEWQWQQLDTHGWADDQKDWTNGVLYTGMMAWAKLSGDHTYKKLIRIGEENNWKIGNNRYFADDYCIGQTYVQLYGIFRNPAYIRDFKNMADTLMLKPHQESLAWVNKIHLREWAWCDALYMGPPALAFLTEATGDQRYLKTAVKLWWKSSRHLYDEQEHLFFRDSRYFDKREKNGAKVFWSRGNGWVLAGLARLLSTMPDSNKEKGQLVKQYKEMAARIISLQQADGSWHASLLDPQTYPSKETSGTALFCYALCWGINAHILAYDEFHPAVAKAWNMLKTAVHPNGMLGYVQQKGVSPDMVNYNATDVYGVGAFLLAGTEMLKLKLSYLPDVFLVDTASQAVSPAQTRKISVNWADIEAKVKGAEQKNIKVVNALTGKQLIFNVEHKGKQDWLFFNAAIPTGSQQYWLIEKTNR